MTRLYDCPVNKHRKARAENNCTVFLSSHLMSEMAQTADHLLVIAQGRIIADAGTEEFINQNA
ncbi:MAG: ABC transporter ATP-binding protein, partial [Rhodomicrobium sp.]